MRTRDMWGRPKSRFVESRHGDRAVLDFDADELRNIAYALGLDDAGAKDMLELADELDERNGVSLDGDEEEQP